MVEGMGRNVTKEDRRKNYLRVSDSDEGFYYKCIIDKCGYNKKKERKNVD